MDRDDSPDASEMTMRDVFAIMAPETLIRQQAERRLTKWRENNPYVRFAPDLVDFEVLARYHYADALLSARWETLD